jgi:YVTN family beta-propeller protein
VGASRSIRKPAIALLALLTGCSRPHFPDVPAGYREFAYVTNGGSNTVSVLDLVYMRQDRTLAVGIQPTGIAANPLRNEIYAVNAGPPNGSGSISVIDTETNAVVATIPVHKLPYAIAVSPDGRRAYVANSGSNTVSVLDLDRRREIGVAGTGEQPDLARVSPDSRTLLVTNRGSGSVSIFALTPGPPRLRVAFSGCPGATDAVILADSSKAFIACSGGHQVMAIQLAADPTTWPAKQNPALQQDRMIALLDVGQTPVQLALKPDGGEIFVSNFGSDTISEIETQANEVAGTYIIGSKPVFGVVSADNGTLWVSNFGAESINLWSIDDGRLGGRVRAGDGPDALAFSADEHLLLAADAHSGDVAVIRTAGNPGPALFTIMPAGRSPNAIAIKAMQAKP